AAAAKAIGTAGLNCAPETGPSGRIIKARIALFANVLHKSARRVLWITCGQAFSAQQTRKIPASLEDSEADISRPPPGGGVFRAHLSTLPVKVDSACPSERQRLTVAASVSLSRSSAGCSRNPQSADPG